MLHWATNLEKASVQKKVGFDESTFFQKATRSRIDIVYIITYTMMDIQYTLHTITFEWDSHKSAVNVYKHDVSFKAACQVFFDPFLRYLEDEMVDGELCETIIGMTESWHSLYVVYVLREDIIRIISARKVTKSEREWYENQ